MSNSQLATRNSLLGVGGLLLMLLIIASGSALWMGLAVLLLVGFAVLSRIGPVGVLYIYCALIWLLPRVYLPGFDTIVPLHVLLIGGAGLLWAVDFFTASTRNPGAALPPFWPLVAVYSLGGFLGFFTGRTDVDTTNGLKFLVEACLVAPVLYLLAWRYMRSPKDAEQLMLILSASTVLLGIIAYLFQGSAFWTPIPFEKEGLRLSGQYQFGGIYLIVTPVMMSTQLSMLIPALSALAITSASTRRRIASVALLAPLTFIILLAAGRSGWLGTTAGLALVLFFSVRAGKVSLPKLGFVMAAVAVAGVLLTASLGLVNDEIARRLMSFGSLLNDDTVVFRYWIWGLGLELIGQYPLGVGFQVIRGLYGYPAHNQYILWALGTGVGGFVAAMVFVSGSLFNMAKALLRGYDTPLLAATLGSLAAVVGALISINGDNISTSVGWTQSSLWLMLGIGAAAYGYRVMSTE